MQRDDAVKQISSSAGHEMPVLLGKSPYYQSSSLPLASRLAGRVRRRIFQIFMDVFHPTAATSVLDVGVTSDSDHAESNFFERLYPYPNRLTCVGTEDGSHLMREYPGLRYLPVVSGRPLPFSDRQFDIVFSNAVLEHVGSRGAQVRFAAELRRISKQFFVVTPNRWFPIEHHTGLPFLHYLPPSLFRDLIRNTRYRYWADESNLNILTAREMAGLFPGVKTRIKIVRVFGIGSNLVAYGNSRMDYESVC